jgi:hypothetical protein
MKAFAWANEDVQGWLQSVCDGKKKAKEVAEVILREYSRTVSLKTVYNHLPKQTEAEVGADDIM